MEMPITALSPIHVFGDNMRPAQLMLQVYQLLDANDRIQTEGEMVSALRTLLHASPGEDVMLIYNELFLGFVRERAQVHRSTLRQTTLQHLLRQAVVASCTAFETYLPALLYNNLPVMIRARGRDVFPRDDGTVGQYFQELSFTLDEVMRLLSDENAADFIAAKILSRTKYKYITGRKGVHVVAVLLGLRQPWDRIAEHLHMDKTELTRMIEETVSRRNDIVHRADRAQDAPSGKQQDISFAWTQRAVHDIEHVCKALDELVAAVMEETRALAGVS